jgi:hypothetical protein
MNPITTALAAIVGTAVLLCGWYELKRIPGETQAARSAVLLEVKDNQIRAALKAEEDRKAAQAKISRIEADYFSRQSSDAAKIQDLEMEIVNAAPSNPACPDGFSVGLRNRIDSIGREAITGGNPAVSAPAVRPASRASQRSPVVRHGSPLLGKGPIKP